MTATSASRRTNDRSAGTPAAPADPTDTAPMGTPTVTGPAKVSARVYAGLIDLACGALVCAILTVLCRVVGALDWAVALLVAVVIVLAIRELLLARTGWTLGGRITGVRLLSTRTGLPPRSELFLHADLTFICIAPTLGIGAILLMRTVATDPQGRGWHDRLTGVKAVAVSRSSASTDSQSGPRAAFAGGATGQGPFSDGRFSFTGPGTPINEVGSTVDTTRTMTPSPNARSAIIDSVPWSAVPTPLDSTTDDAPAASYTGEQSEGPAAPTGEPRRRAAAPSHSHGHQAPTRRRRSTSHRKPDSDSHGKSDSDVIRIRLVPADGGAPILLTTPTVLGRDPQNISEYPEAARVALPDVSRSISKTHAAVAPVPGGLWVTDLHSTNGTRITQEDGAKQTAAQPEVPIPAPVGSVLILGRASYRVED